MAEKFNFDKGLQKLEEIVRKMESGELGLEDSLAHFEKGVALVKKCQKALQEAEQRVRVLSAKDGFDKDRPLRD